MLVSLAWMFALWKLPLEKLWVFQIQFEVLLRGQVGKFNAGLGC